MEKLNRRLHGGHMELEPQLLIEVSRRACYFLPGLLLVHKQNSQYKLNIVSPGLPSCLTTSSILQ
jgi:hypothetical protein